MYLLCFTYLISIYSYDHQSSIYFYNKLYISYTVAYGLRRFSLFQIDISELDTYDVCIILKIITHVFENIKKKKLASNYFR